MVEQAIAKIRAEMDANNTYIQVVGHFLVLHHARSVWGAKRGGCHRSESEFDLRRVARCGRCFAGEAQHIV